MIEDNFHKLMIIHDLINFFFFVVSNQEHPTYCIHYIKLFCEVYINYSFHCKKKFNIMYTM